MILLPPATALSGVEQFGLDILIDLSRLLPAHRPLSEEIVRLELSDREPEFLDLKGCAARDWYFRRAEGVVSVPRAVLGFIGGIAGAVAEQKTHAADKHGRVPSLEAPVVVAGVERQAVISRAGKALREAVVASAQRRPVRLVTPWPEARRWAVALTHDLDLVSLWPLAAGARVVELARRGRLGLALNAAAHALLAIGSNPVWRGVQAVLAPEGNFSARSTWFVICETPTLKTVFSADVTYRPESDAARRIFRDIMGRAEIGLHGSFATSTGDGVFERQRDRLTGLTSQSPSGIRQHFLRLRPDSTPAKMRAAGFHYDSSYGFSDRNGFRLGVADVVPLWDAARGERVGMEEAPFCWMDRALSKYQAVEDPGAWVDDGLELATETRLVDGVWVGVWHPNIHPSLGFPGATVAFERLLAEIAAHHPFFASLSTIVHWRAARRAVRATAIAPDGSVQADGPAGAHFPLFLEDAQAHRLELVRTQ